MNFRSSARFLSRLASRRAAHLLSAAVVGGGFLAVPLTRGANYYWDGGTTNITGVGDGVSSGTGGTWSTSITNWDVGSGLAHSVWVDGNTAIFGNTQTGSTVNLGTAISALGMTFNTGGYGVNLNSSTLTLGTGGLATTAAGRQPSATAARAAASP